jgi:hypothetical protein
MAMNKLNWKRPLFYLLLPIFLVMVFVGFPLPLAPPPALKAGQEQSATVRRRKRHLPWWLRYERAEDDEADR